MGKKQVKWPIDHLLPSELPFEEHKPIHSRPSLKGLSFFDLPGEIRNPIYRHVLVSNGIKPEFLSRTEEKKGPRKLTEKMKGPMKLKVLTRFPCPQGYFTRDHSLVPARKVLALFFTCKQIYREAKGIFWAENSFLFNDFLEAHTFLKMLGRERRNLISRFGVPIGRLNFPQRDIFSDIDIALGLFGRSEHLFAVIRTIDEIRNKGRLKGGERCRLDSPPHGSTRSSGVDGLHIATVSIGLPSPKPTPDESLLENVRGRSETDGGWTYAIESLERQHSTRLLSSPWIFDPDEALLRLLRWISQGDKDLQRCFRRAGKKNNAFLQFFRSISMTDADLRNAFELDRYSSVMVRCVLWAKKIEVPKDQ